jgi:hypothetical protein
MHEDYLALMRHFDMTPRTTEIAAKEQNGDVEAGHRALKSRLEQALLMRGTRDFESVEAWQAFVHDVLRKANAARGSRVGEELAAMRPIAVARLPEFTEEKARVSAWSTIRVRHCAYSVPSRLIGEILEVLVFEDRLEVHFAGELQLACERLRGRNRLRIDYRHVIWSLVASPRLRAICTARNVPSLAFRRAYDAIREVHSGVRGDLEYLPHPPPRREHDRGGRRDRPRTAARRAAVRHRPSGEGARERCCADRGPRSGARTDRPRRL